jgi:hypothetical protein
MKALPPIVFFACVASSVFADEPVVPTSSRTARLDVLKSQFKFAVDPVASAPDVRPVSGGEPVVDMEPFIVTAYVTNRALPAILQQQEQTFREKKFSLQKGGVFFARKGKVFTSELRLKFGPISHGLELFRMSISW